MNDLGKRTHEVRCGMSLVYGETRPDGDGFAWAALDGSVAGRTAGDRHDAFCAMRAAVAIELRARDTAEWSAR